MKITHIDIKMFKGIKGKAIDFGDRTSIKAANGKGKTTVYDAFWWLLFGKDSDGRSGTGRSPFSIHPLDSDNNVIRGLVTVVEGVVDGISLKKQLTEKVGRDGSFSYETACWYNGAPKSITEYQGLIAKMMPEETFKLLTNLRYFNELHWEEQRKILTGLDPEIMAKLEEVRKANGGLTLEEKKKVLSDKRKLLKKERDEITPRIDEIQRGLEEYAADEDLSNKRETILADLGAFADKRSRIHSSEVSRQLVLDEIAGLKRDRGDREGELKADVSGIQTLLKEKLKIAEQVGGYKADVLATEREIKTYEDDMHSFKQSLETETTALTEIREKYTKASEATTDCTCYACGQSLPDDKLVAINEKREKDLQKIITDGNQIKKDIADGKSNMEGCQAKFEDATKKLANQKQQVVDAEKYKEDRFAEIQVSIDNNETPQPMMDDKWKEISAKITRMESEVGASVADQITLIDEDIQTSQDDLAELDKALALADESAKDKKRIDELSAKQKELSQKIADLDKETVEVEKYQAEVSAMVENAVNGKFAHVKFKLFNTLLNGTVEPCCVATLDGVPYSDMSGGQKIYAGVDIVNVLSDHYDQSAPLFVDNSESLTLPLEAKSQTIQLFAVDGMELTVEVA